MDQSASFRVEGAGAGLQGEGEGVLIGSGSAPEHSTVEADRRVAVAGGGVGSDEGVP